MFVLRSQLPPLQAQHLAAFLRAEGIVTGVFHPLTSLGGYDVRPPGSSVVLLHRRDEARAGALADEFDALPLPSPSDAADSEAALDLSRLPQSLTVACPHCQAAVVARDNPAACPACSHTLDITQLIVDQLGPEALAPCYDDEPAAVFSDTAGVACPTCGYWLEGLERRGTCPECRNPYDKDAIVSAFLNDLSQGRLMGEHDPR